MNKGVVSDTAKTSKNLAKQIAKQIAREPFEIAKTATSQVSGLEKTTQAPPQQEGERKIEPKVQKEEEKKKKEKDLRIIQALEAEIKEIREQKEKKEEEKKVQEAQQVQEEPKILAEPQAKRGRKLFGFGQKAQAERLKTRVEKPVPASG